MAVDTPTNDDDDLYSGPPRDANLVVISPAGDVLITLYDGGARQTYVFRVQAERLRHGSPYFVNLLHPEKFAEGSRACRQMAALRERYDDMSEATAEQLPRVAVSDIGRISGVKSVKMLAADFFRVLHGQELSTANPPVPNLANLAVVADRFDAVPVLARYVRKQRYLQLLDAKTNRGTGSNLSEERIRQKLLIGLLLDHGTWVSMYSKRLIVKSSSRWTAEALEDHDCALWWDLPQSVEEEMMQRREYILDTLQSIQTHFLKLYTQGERQCKLGYDSSIQCDSFQLGEMVRFFHRVDTFPLRGSIFNPDGATQYPGDIERLIDAVRQCPEYQIDANHKHCGLRTRLLPLLDHIQRHLSLDTANVDIGVCAECWQAHRAEYRWSDAKRPVSWSASMMGVRLTAGTGPRRAGEGSVCLTRHLHVRDMFMAATRDWTARDL